MHLVSKLQLTTFSRDLRNIALLRTKAAKLQSRVNFFLWILTSISNPPVDHIAVMLCSEAIEVISEQGLRVERLV